jgi:Fur family ferric uptake transcriptional regulator
MAAPVKKLRVTRQRQFILDEIGRSSEHPTADEIYRRVRRKLPRISLGTVYRNLEVLSESGLVRRLTPGGGQMRFDARLSPHYHVRCTVCGRVEDVLVPERADLEQEAARATGYEIDGHTLFFEGICPQCRARRAAH